MKTLIKVRLKRDHYHDGRKRPAGTVLRLGREAAEWLCGLGVAKVLPDTKQNPPNGGRKG